MSHRLEMPLRRLVHCGLLALAFCAGCSSSNPSTTTTPTTPTPTTVTETFQGTLTPNGAATYYFTATDAGTVTATLTTVSPDSTIVLGISLGVWNGTFCTPIIANDQAAQGAVITGTLAAAANLCVHIYDSQGNVVSSEAYTITANHP